MSESASDLIRLRLGSNGGQITSSTSDVCFVPKACQTGQCEFGLLHQPAEKLTTSAARAARRRVTVSRADPPCAGSRGNVQVLQILAGDDAPRRCIPRAWPLIEFNGPNHGISALFDVSRRHDWPPGKARTSPCPPIAGSPRWRWHRHTGVRERDRSKLHDPVFRVVRVVSAWPCDVSMPSLA